MLGSALASEAHHFPRFQVRAPGHEELDVGDAAAVMGWSAWVAGGWIVHCAARVDVEGCARDPDGARATIVEGTRHVARLAAECGARVLYPQSFLVYDGHRNPIPEDEEPRPLSLYGQLKHEAEQVLCATVPSPLVVRMAGFFGGEAADKNFVGRIIPVIHAAILRGQRRFDVGTRVWQPTWTRDLAANSLLLMARDATGHYQMSCHGQATFAEVAQEVVRGLGWQDRIEIVPVDASSVTQNELGRRPDRAVLSCTRLVTEHMNLQRDWRATLNAYLSHPFFDRYRMEPPV
jgi:dTDP-4-dehydrorhamnose reductase